MLFLDENDRLCTFAEGGAFPLDTEVRYAASGVDAALIYVKADGTLWMIPSLTAEEWYRTAPTQILNGVAMVG